MPLSLLLGGFLVPLNAFLASQQKQNRHLKIVTLFRTRSLPFGDFLHFPSNQSTYSTEPRRNLIGILDLSPQLCSILQKKGNVSADHLGRKMGCIASSGTFCCRGFTTSEKNDFSSMWGVLAKTAVRSSAKFFPSEKPQDWAGRMAERLMKSDIRMIRFIFSAKSGCIKVARNLTFVKIRFE